MWLTLGGHNWIVILCDSLAEPYYPDMWLNIILDVSVRVFWMRLTLKSVDLDQSRLFFTRWVGFI
jgi:hypothetical protein